jgi:hypothetical protein
MQSYKTSVNIQLAINSTPDYSGKVWHLGSIFKTCKVTEEFTEMQHVAINFTFCVNPQKALMIYYNKGIERPQY